MKLLIVDYGMGNIKSIFSAFKYLGVADIVLSNSYSEMEKADKIILPGVGSFGKAIGKIREEQIDLSLKRIVLGEKKPILGICLGMQLLAMSSDEDGVNEGLGMVSTKVRKFPKMDNLKVPHVGFNQISHNAKSKLFSGIKNNPDFYFTHSYRMTGDADICPSFCKYGAEEFIAAFEKENIAGVQFHPELSQTNGLQLLRNFLEKF